QDGHSHSLPDALPFSAAIRPLPPDPIPGLDVTSPLPAGVLVGWRRLYGSARHHADVAAVRAVLAAAVVIVVTEGVEAAARAAPVVLEVGRAACRAWG